VSDSERSVRLVLAFCVVGWLIACFDFDTALGSCVDAGRCPGTADSGVDGGAAKWRQTVEGFNDSGVYDGGGGTCGVSINADAGNKVTSFAVALSDSTFVTSGRPYATAQVLSAGWLPSGPRGKLHGTINFQGPTPSGGGQASAVIVRIDDSGGDDIVEVSVDQDGYLSTYSHAGTLTDSGIGASSATRINAGVPHTFDISWQLGAFMTLTVDQGVAGASNVLSAYASDAAVPIALNLGIYRVSGDAGSSASAIYSEWELSDDPDAGL
jgi:hypothetical protein